MKERKDAHVLLLTSSICQKAAKQRQPLHLLPLTIFTPPSTPFHWKMWCTPGILNPAPLSQNPFHVFSHQINLAVLRGKCCITDAVNVQCMPVFTHDVPRWDNGRGQGELFWGSCTELIRGTARSQLQGPALFAMSCCGYTFKHTCAKEW